MASPAVAGAHRLAGDHVAVAGEGPLAGGEEPLVDLTPGSRHQSFERGIEPCGLVHGVILARRGLASGKLQSDRRLIVTGSLTQCHTFQDVALPVGRRISLPGRGTTFVREVAGPEGAPTVLLLHGWLASGGLNWFPAFEPLGRHYRVLAIDHRGHGRGIRSHRRFTLAACADDAAALRGGARHRTGRGRRLLPRRARRPAPLEAAPRARSADWCSRPRRTPSCPGCASNCSSAR